MSATETFRKRLRKARRDAEMSQGELGVAAGTTKESIYRMEAGRSLHWLRKLELIAELLDRPLSWFFEPERAGAAPGEPLAPTAERGVA